MRRWCLAAVGLCCFLPAKARAGEDDVRAEAADALRRAVDFFVEEVSCEGGYLWRYSHDLKLREGEGRASATTVWVQPPGTPSVGMALLEAYRTCGARHCLDAARKAAGALVRGQLRSGGWDYRIEFDPQRRRRYAYRVDEPREEARNTTTLDDNTTQAALRFLMALDRETEFGDEELHGTVLYALEHLLAAQYPNGAWPQRFSAPPKAEDFPVLRASYPESWSRKYPGRDYKAHYTFNDNTIADTIDTMLRAGEIYEEPKYRAAALKAADFILLAQMPEPQPAWAQQYDAAMHPAWARKFEPPSVTGGESQGVMRTLLAIYRETGDRKYLEPLPRAIAYFRRSLRPDGRLARFYELKTNKPLYFVKGTYELTYSDDNMPTHYGFVVSNGIERIAEEYERAKALPPEKLKPPLRPRRGGAKPSAALVSQTKAVISAQDERGAWVEQGHMRYQQDNDATERVIECRTFIRNVAMLARYLGATAE